MRVLIYGVALYTPYFELALAHGECRAVGRYDRCMNRRVGVAVVRWVAPHDHELWPSGHS